MDTFGLKIIASDRVFTKDAAEACNSGAMVKRESCRTMKIW